MREGGYICEKTEIMMTREEIAAVDRECEEQHISQQAYLESREIARHQYYRWKRRYREEDEQSLVPAGFVPMMQGSIQAQSVPVQRSRGKQQMSPAASRRSPGWEGPSSIHTPFSRG